MIATPHSKSTIARSLRMASLAVTRNTFTFTLTSPDSVCIKVYSDSLTNHRFVVGLGQYFGEGWVHVSDEFNIPSELPWLSCIEYEYSEMLVKAPENAQRMKGGRFLGSASCKPISLEQPGSFRFRPSCGNAQRRVELNLRYLTTVSVTYQVNGQPSMLTWVVFFGTSQYWFTIYLGSRRSQL